MALTHLDERGNARMVDVSDKGETTRTAVAVGRVVVSPEALMQVQSGVAKKGDVVAVARVAGLMAMKKTAELIPLCHPVRLVGSELEIEIDGAAGAILLRATARALDRTGVEMEALTGVTVAALTIYDMLKAVDRSIALGPFVLEHKEGGKSGTWSRKAP